MGVGKVPCRIKSVVFGGHGTGVHTCLLLVKRKATLTRGWDVTCEGRHTVIVRDVTCEGRHTVIVRDVTCEGRHTVIVWPTAVRSGRSGRSPARGLRGVRRVVPTDM
jgi:hypothetical protein